MSDTGACNKTRLPLLISVAINIFLIAFVSARLSAPGMLPPPFAGNHKMFPPMMHGELPPPPPPLLISPADLFTPEEMKQDFVKLEKNFEEIKVLRKQFSHQLEQGPISKEEALKHFAEVDHLMDNVKDKAQEKAAEKIGSMSPEDRKQLATKLLGDE